MKQINKTLTLFFGSLLVFVAFCFLIQNQFYNQTGQTIGSISEDSNVDEISIKYSNIERELSRSDIVQALPKYSIILLKFYNFESGEMEWEKAYIIEENKVKETNDFNKYSEITFSIHSKYLEGLTNKNFCEVIKQAKEKGDLDIKTELSTIRLIWKFKSMYDYRECLGF